MKNVDASYEYLAAMQIEPQIHALAKELAGARTGVAVESVHQARVASRRLRSALQMFGGCFQPKKFKRWRNGVRDIAQELGTVRDLDVQIIYLEQAIAELGGDDGEAFRAGMSRVQLRRKQMREAAQPAVEKAIDKFEKSGILEEIHGEVVPTIFALGRQNCGFESAYVFAQSAKHICGRVDELVAYEECLEESGEVPQHHAMRIAAKRLRYTLEVCGPAFGQELAPITKQVKKLQALLGDIHDCDVWVAQIDDFIAEELARTRAYFGDDGPFALLQPGIEYLRENRMARRAALFDDTAALWYRLKEENTWGALTDLVRGKSKAMAEDLEENETSDEEESN